jgi:hypothetical protein
LNESEVRINTSWFVDEYEGFTHYLRSQEGTEFLIAKIELGEAFEDKLTEVLTWNREDLTPHDAKNPWANDGKEEWEKMWSTERFPFLRL